MKSQLIRGASAEATIIGFLRFLNLGERKNTSRAKKKTTTITCDGRIRTCVAAERDGRRGWGGLTVPPQMFQVCRVGYEAQTGDLARGLEKKGITVQD